MLNLFKIPFWQRHEDKDDCLPQEIVSSQILRNYMKRKNFSSDAEWEQAEQLIDAEIHNLRQQLSESSPAEHYDLIQNALQNIDEQLREL